MANPWEQDWARTPDAEDGPWARGWAKPAAPAKTSVGEDLKDVGTAVVGTVKGDLHDIGKNLVALMMRSANLEVIDLGSNVDGAKFIDAINKYNPDVIGLSALLTTTMNEQGHIIQQLTDAGVRDKVKVMVGGAPVTQMWADKIGADAFTADAAEAAQWAKTYAASKGA